MLSIVVTEELWSEMLQCPVCAEKNSILETDYYENNEYGFLIDANLVCLLCGHTNYYHDTIFDFIIIGSW